MVECEYCGADDRILYAWHADVWCGRCISAYKSALLPLIGKLEDAPRGRPPASEYAKPFIWQTPDGHIQGGVVRV